MSSQKKHAPNYAALSVKGGRPKKSKHELSSARPTIRYTNAQIAFVDAAASQIGKTRSQYIRDASLNVIIPSSRRTNIDNKTLLSLHKVAQSLVPIGTNINQIAHAANLGKTLDGKLSNAMEELQNRLAQIEILLDKVADTYDS